MQRKQTILILLYIFSFSIYSYSQCIDSFENKSLYKEDFKYITSAIPLPLLDNESSVIYGAQSYFIKKNKFNEIEWVKKIDGGDIRHRFITERNGIVGVFNDEPGGPSSGQRGFFKLKATGNLDWSKKLQFSNDNLNYFSSILHANKGIDDDIIFSYVYYNNIGITILDSNASLQKLNKYFKVDLDPGERFSSVHIEVANNSIFMVAIVSKSSSLLEKNNLLLIKLNYSTGRIEKVSYLHANDELRIPNPPYGNYIIQGTFSDHLNLKSINNKYLLIAGRKGENYIDNNRFYAIRIDTNLATRNYVIYKSPHNYFRSSASATVPFINRKGDILYTSIKNPDGIFYPQIVDSCFYFISDKTFNIQTQRYFKISETGQIVGSDNISATPLLKDNGNVEIILNSRGSDSANLLMVNIPTGFISTPCTSKETQFITPESPGFTQLPSPSIQELDPIAITITPYPLVVKDDSVEEREFCVQKSICDTIKILGQTKICLPEDTATFTLIKNPLCLRQTAWATDSSAIKIISRSGDTAIKVKFLRPYSGYIKASFEGCTLADSLFIEVSAPAPSLNIGSDTTLCPGKNIVLHATKGFQNYLWQNGTNADSLVASTPGIYSLTATGFCGQVFGDTVIIARIRNDFLINRPPPICLYDTAQIILYNQFKNYEWIPSEKGMLNNDVLYLFPDTTTKYLISAEAFTDCIVTDTITIMVQDCPQQIFFPNAFSPNNDGLNDTFKPLITGKVRQFKFTVFNRYGQIIFQTTDPAMGWDGSYKNEQQEPGMYIWICETEFRGRQYKSLKGKVFLIR